MGTHPNGPSVLAEQPTKSLKEKIESNPNELLSSEISKMYNGDLPFLFKVLSVRKSLSIQAHPDKKLGKELFEKFPKIYKGEINLKIYIYIYILFIYLFIFLKKKLFELLFSLT